MFLLRSYPSLAEQKFAGSSRRGKTRKVVSVVFCYRVCLPSIISSVPQITSGASVAKKNVSSGAIISYAVNKIYLVLSFSKELNYMVADDLPYLLTVSEIWLGFKNQREMLLFRQ